MTMTQFITECLAVTVSPEIALENENIVIALENRNDKEVIRLLETEF